MSKALYAVIAAVIVVAGGAIVWLHFPNGNGGVDTDPSDPSMTYSDLPDGISADMGTCTFRASSDTVWKVYDRFHTYYDTSSYGSFTTRYEGTESTGKELHLEPGSYIVAANGGKFTVTVFGDLSVEKTWKYDMDGTVVDATVSYTVPVKELAAEWDFADGFNTRGSPVGAVAGEIVYQFEDLPQLVRAGDSVRSAAESIRAEYLRLGGDSDDRQSFLDFIAGFVQKAVRYPSTVSGHEYDYGIYGEDEYWAVPAQTLWLLYGDCEDDAALFCALASCFGYETAMAGKAGHVFAGVVVDGFVETDSSRLSSLGVSYMKHVSSTDVHGTSGKIFQAVELIKGQAPVGYCMSVSFGSKTFWGDTGFYPVG